MPSYPTGIHESVLPSPLLIVEDDWVMQLRLRNILETLGYTDDVLSFVGSIAEARALLVDEPFAMALIDVGLPDGNGIDLIRTLHQRDEPLPILVISAWSSGYIIVSALQAGATGYLLKERDDIEIALSIRSALRGGAPIDPFIAKHILGLANLAGLKAANGSGSATAATPASSLSRREIEVLQLVGRGMSNREISELLCVSKSTIECHIKNIYKKLAVHSRTEAVYEARSHGLLS